MRAVFHVAVSSFMTLVALSDKSLVNFEIEIEMTSKTLL